MAWASISAARSAAGVSVVKNGVPVPPAKITTRPFSRGRMARRRVEGSAIFGISMAVCTRVGWPTRSRASCRARPFMTVAIMPMWSAWLRSMPAPTPFRPRQKLPPPTTTAMSTPRRVRTSTISSATCWRMSESSPNPVGSANASPESLRTIRDQRGMSAGSPREATVMSADLDLGEAHDLGPAEELGDRLLLVLGVGLLQEADLLVEAVEAALDDLGQRRLGLALVAADGLERRPLLLDLIG